MVFNLGGRVSKEINVPTRDDRIDLLVKDARKIFGVDSVRNLGKDEVVAWPALSTGLVSLDNILGIGGLPLGRSTEVYGPEGAGKTTFCLSVVAQAQKRGGLAVYIDAEHALDLSYAKRIGVDIDSLLLCQPDSAEQSLDMFELMAKKLVAGDIVVLDSVAAMVPQEELEKSTGDWQMGLQARLMGKGIRKCTGFIAKNQVVALWVNQLRDNIGYMAGESTPGGRALKFAASVRLDIRKVGKLLGVKGNEYGAEIAIRTVKNKMATPFLKTKVKLIYGEGFSKESALIDEGLRLGVIKQSGSWYGLLGENQQGTEGYRQRMIDDLDYFSKVEKLVKDALEPKKIVAVIEIVVEEQAEDSKENAGVENTKEKAEVEILEN